MCPAPSGVKDPVGGRRAPFSSKCRPATPRWPCVQQRPKDVEHEIDQHRRTSRGRRFRRASTGAGRAHRPCAPTVKHCCCSRASAPPPLMALLRHLRKKAQRPGAPRTRASVSPRGQVVARQPHRLSVTEICVKHGCPLDKNVHSPARAASAGVDFVPVAATEAGHMATALTGSNSRTSGASQHVVLAKPPLGPRQRHPPRPANNPSNLYRARHSGSAVIRTQPAEGEQVGLGAAGRH